MASTYASTLTAPTEIMWADRYSEWGDDENIRTSRVSMHDWAYGADANTGSFPYKKQFLYFVGEYRWYQAQVRLRRRFVFNDTHDGSWEEWSPWSDKDFNVGESRGSNNANNWTSGANVDTKHINTPYNTFDFGANQPAFITNTNDLSEYDMVQMEIRIRAYRPANGGQGARHGDWAYQVLEIWYQPGAELSNAVLLADGSIRFNYYTAWTRNGGKIEFEEVTWKGKNILLDGKVAIKNLRAANESSTPSPSPEPAKQVIIPADRISESINLDVDDVIRVVKANFYDTDGSKMDVKPISLTLWPDAPKKSGTPRLVFTFSTLRALTVTATSQGDPYPWEKAECSIRWAAPDGTTKTLQADSITVEPGKATCVFRTPPMDVELTVNFVAISNVNDKANTSWGKASGTTEVASESMMTFRVDTHTASCVFNDQWSGDFTPYAEMVDLAGRERPTSRVATGGTKALSISGSLIRRGPVAENRASATLNDWVKAERLAHHDGILRLPGGHRLKCHLDGISYSESAESPLTTIKATFAEVS